MQKPLKKDPLDLTDLQSAEFSQLFNTEEENPLGNSYGTSAIEKTPWKIMVFDRFTQQVLSTIFKVTNPPCTSNYVLTTPR